MKSRLLALSFAVLVLCNAGYVLLGIASIPRYYERVTTSTVPPLQFGSTDVASNTRFQQEAAQRGLALSQYAVEQTALGSLMVLLLGGLAALIVWRGRHNWYAWYTAFFLVFIAEIALRDQGHVARLLPVYAYDTSDIFWPLVPLYFFLFPNGKPTPRRALWIVLPVFLIHSIYQTARAIMEFFPNPEWIARLEGATPSIQLLVGLGAVAILISQVYRYARAATPLEKQQTKWFLFALGGFCLSFTLVLVPNERFAFKSEIGTLWGALAPLSIGIAILRYRLWDIDLLIRRTLIYSGLTALLALVYFGSVALLQQVLRGLIGAGNDIAIILSTLAIAVLFNPLRGRVQQSIDRRFYRRKYDAQQVLAAFGATVRDEVDLNRLRDQLVSVVQETMQPAGVSLWLKDERKLEEGKRR